MDVSNIKDKYKELNLELKQALTTMERSDRIFAIRDAIKDLQKLCPHNNDFSQTNECPYCGKRFKG